MARVSTQDKDGVTYLNVVQDYKTKDGWRQLTFGMGRYTPRNWCRAEFLATLVTKATQAPAASNLAGAEPQEWHHAHELAALEHLGSDVLSRLKQAGILAGGQA